MILIGIGNQGQLFHHVEFVNSDTGKISSFGLPDLWFADNDCYGLIQIGLLVGMELFGGLDETVRLQDFQF